MEGVTESWVWAQVITARLTGQRVRGAFCYGLAEEGLRLEAFQARLLPAGVENCGSAVVVRLTVEMIALLRDGTGERRIFRRTECLLRRFPAERISCAGTLPREWKPVTDALIYEPVLARAVLRVVLSLSLSLYGVRSEALLLPDGNCLEKAPPPRLTEMEEALQRCRSELEEIKRRLPRENKPKARAYTKEAAARARSRE